MSPGVRPSDGWGMPYDRNDELPASVREKYTSKQQRAFRKAYNDAAQRGEPESKRFQIAHAAARKAGDRDATQQKVGHRSKEKASLRLEPTGDGMDEAKKHKRDGKKGYRRSKDGASLECVHEDCTRVFATEVAAEDHALAVHTHDEIRSALQKALRVAHAGPPRTWTYVMTTADDWFVYEVEGSYGTEAKLFRQGFTFDNGVATLKGTPVEVRQRTVFEPVATDSAKAGTPSENPKKPGVKNDVFVCPTCDSEFESDGDLKDHKKKKSH